MPKNIPMGYVLKTQGKHQIHTLYNIDNQITKYFILSQSLYIITKQCTRFLMNQTLITLLIEIITISKFCIRLI